MDEETKARFDDVSAALGMINTVLAEIIEGMATRKELDARSTRQPRSSQAWRPRSREWRTKELDARFDAIMARMNDSFERVLEKQQTLQVADDTLSQRVTRLEQDVRQLRGGLISCVVYCNERPSRHWPCGTARRPLKISSDHAQIQ